MPKTSWPGSLRRRQTSSSGKWSRSGRFTNGASRHPAGKGHHLSRSVRTGEVDLSRQSGAPLQSRLPKLGNGATPDRRTITPRFRSTSIRGFLGFFVRGPALSDGHPGIFDFRPLWARSQSIVEISTRSPAGVTSLTVTEYPSEFHISPGPRSAVPSGGLEMEPTTIGPSPVGTDVSTL